MSRRTLALLALLVAAAAVTHARPHRHSEDRRSHSHYRSDRDRSGRDDRERERERDGAQYYASRPLPRLQQLADTVAAMARQQAQEQQTEAQTQAQAQAADAPQNVDGGFSFASAGGRARHREESGGINFYYDASNMPSWLSPPWVTSAFRTGPLALPNPGEGSTEEGPMFMGVPPQPILPFDSQLPAEAQPISTNLANYPTNAIPTGADLNAGQSPPVTTANSQPGANQPGEAQSPAEQQADGGQAEGGDDFLFLLQVAAHHHALALHHMRQHQHALHALKQRHAAKMDTVADAHDQQEARASSQQQQEGRGRGSEAEKDQHQAEQRAESASAAASSGPEPDFSTLIETNAHESTVDLSAGPHRTAPPVSFHSSAAYQHPFAWMHDYGYPTSNTAYRTWQPYYPQQAYPFPAFGFPQ